VIQLRLHAWTAGSLRRPVFFGCAFAPIAVGAGIDRGSCHRRLMDAAPAKLAAGIILTGNPPAHGAKNTRKGCLGSGHPVSSWQSPRGLLLGRVIGGGLGRARSDAHSKPVQTAARLLRLGSLRVTLDETAELADSRVALAGRDQRLALA
jgi:hypothetical protein